MKLHVFYFLVLGFIIEFSDGDGGGHHKHVKIIVPAVYHKHTHKHTVYEKIPVIKKHVVVHQHKHEHGHKHGHDHDHKHKHNHGHKHGHKHKHDHKHKHKHDHYKHEKPHHEHGHDDHDYHWNHYRAEKYESEPKNHDNFEVEPIYFNDDDGYHTSKKSVKSEHFEVKRLNPNPLYPDDKYVVRGSYKVEETDPFDFTTTSYHSYDSPVGKEIAQALTNFGGKYDSFGPFKKKKNEDDYSDEEKGNEKQTEANYENLIDYDDHKQKGYQGYQGYREYDDYGDNTKAVKQYEPHSDSGKQQEDDGRYNYGNEASLHYVSRNYYDNFDGGK